MRERCYIFADREERKEGRTQQCSRLPCDEAQVSSSVRRTGAVFKLWVLSPLQIAFGLTAPESSY